MTRRKQLDGPFSAYSADKGEDLWHDAQNAVLAAPITYGANSRQYITFLVGIGTSVEGLDAAFAGLKFDYRAQKRRFLRSY